MVLAVGVCECVWLFVCVSVAWSGVKWGEEGRRRWGKGVRAETMQTRRWHILLQCNRIQLGDDGDG